MLVKRRVFCWARSQICEKRLLLSSCLSIYLSVLPFHPHRTSYLSLNGFYCNLIFAFFFRKSVEKIQVSLKREKKQWTLYTKTNIHLWTYSFISIQPQGPGWQEPEPSHVTGMALAHCILGNFLGVVCHCFPPPLDILTFATRCLYVRNDARDPSSEMWNCGREIFQVILPKFRLPHKFRDLLHAANLRHGTVGFTSPL